MCYAKLSYHSLNSPPDERCVQAFIPHSVRETPASISHGLHRSWYRQTPLWPLRGVQIPRSGVSFLKRGSSFPFQLLVIYLCCVPTDFFYLFKAANTADAVSSCISGTVRAVAVIQQSDCISDDGVVRPDQPPRVPLLRRRLRTGQCCSQGQVLWITWESHMTTRDLHHISALTFSGGATTQFTF